MKKIFLLLFLPTVAFSAWTNFPNPKGSAVSKEECEKVFGGKCFEFPPGIEADEAKLEKVDVETCESTGGAARVCTIEKVDKILIDTAKKEAKEAALLVREQAEAERLLTCTSFKELLVDSVIDNRSTAADVQEVTRRLLGFAKTCLSVGSQ